MTKASIKFDEVYGSYYISGFSSLPKEDDVHVYIIDTYKPAGFSESCLDTEARLYVKDRFIRSTTVWFFRSNEISTAIDLIDWHYDLRLSQRRNLMSEVQDLHFPKSPTRQWFEQHGMSGLQKLNFKIFGGGDSR